MPASVPLGNSARTKQPRKLETPLIPSEDPDSMYYMGGGSGSGEPEPLVKNTGILRESLTWPEALFPAL